VKVPESGIPFLSETRLRFVPFFPLSVGFAPVFPLFGGDAIRIHRGVLPVYLLDLSEAIEQDKMQPLPHPDFLPIFQASPEQVIPERSPSLGEAFPKGYHT